MQAIRSEHTPPQPDSARANPALEPTGAPLPPEAKPARSGVTRYARAVVAVCLLLSLAFLVISNYAGWTARAEVTTVERVCAGAACQQKLVVAGRRQAFLVPENPSVKAGDAAAIRVRCTPGCQVDLVGVWRAGAVQATPVAPGQPALESSVLAHLYGRVFFPALPIVGTIQNTLTGLAQLAWIFVLAQIVFPAVRRRPKFLSYEMTLDIMYVLQTQLLNLTIAGAAVGISTGWLQAHTPVLFPSLAEWPLVLQVLLALWVYDFVVYWRHRLEHQLSFLWPIHAVHHTTTKVDVFTTTRLHPLELMAGGILNMWVTARFGIGQEGASIGFMLYLNYNYYVHSNVKIVYPGFLKYVFVSPFMHRWHHAREAQACDKNFGVIFAWNDWLFGTAIHPDREPLAYGLDYADGEVARDSYIAHLLYPFQVLGVRLYRRVSALGKRRPNALNEPA